MSSGTQSCHHQVLSGSPIGYSQSSFCGGSHFPSGLSTEYPRPTLVVEGSSCEAPPLNDVCSVVFMLVQNRCSRPRTLTAETHLASMDSSIRRHGDQVAV